MKNIKVAILGMGHMGSGHLDRLKGMEGVEIVGLCGKTTEKAEHYNLSRGTDFPVYDSFDRMLTDSGMQALFICLPPYAHTGQLEKAAAKGVHLFIEKPIALSLERGQSMANEAQRAGVITQVGYHMRFGGAVARLRELIDSGAAGRPTLFRASYECNSLHSPWWRDEQKSGGQVVEQVIHLYDMAAYLMGKPQTISGYADNLCHQDAAGYSVDDTSIGLIRFAQGTLGTVTGSNCGVPGLWSAGFRAVFEHLVADFTDHLNGRIIYTKEGNRVEQLCYANDALADEIAHFMKVLRGETAPVATIAEGLLGLEMVLAVKESSRLNGQPIEIRHGN